MTRFARAKGSKACNDKVPEPATSWSEMKKNIVPKSTSTSTSLSKSENGIEENKIDPKPRILPKWASLDNDTVEDYFSLIREHHKKKENNKNDQNVNESSEYTDINNRKHSPENKTNSSNKQADFLDKCKNNSSSVKVIKKGKKRKLIENENENEIKMKTSKDLEEKTNTNEGTKKKKTCKDLEKKSKLKKEKLSKKKDLSSCTVFKNENKIPSKNLKKMENTAHKSKKFDNKGSNKFGNNKVKGKKNFDQKGKFSCSKNQPVEEIIVNGEKVQIVKFQGFNVTYEDAERLKKLRSDMFKEGIPRQQLEAALKLERRRAEKSLSRLKKAVCFHCRGSGHVLSQCPSLTESQNTGTGICYKCGSTEHSALECKVVKGSSFQFAECFICKEQGHIARQCPDNPRGLYPHGGACRDCGAVTHLRKDCPKNIAKKEEDVMTVNVRNSRNVESLDEEIAMEDKRKNNYKSTTKKPLVRF